MGVAGADWNCQLMSVICMSPIGYGSSATVGAGIEFAVDNGANILSMSFGQDGVAEPDPVVEALCAWAVAQGCVLIAAAGNDSTDVIRIPAAFDNVLAVSSINSDGLPSYEFTDYGSWVDVAAPGMGIKTTNCVWGSTTGYTTVNGTSFACPMVAGIAALVMAANPNLTNLEVMQMLMDTADNPESPGGHTDYYGYGVVNAEAAVTAAMGDLANPCTNVETTIDETGATTTWEHDGLDDISGFIVERARNWTGTSPSDSDFETVHIGTDPTERSFFDVAVKRQ
jgi:subtilisin family serine protease